MVIDTYILVDMLRCLEKTVTFIAELERRELTLSTTIINAFELYYGAYKSKKKLQNLEALKKLLERMVTLNMSLKSAEKAGQIHAELETKVQSMGVRDAIIGAIALTEGYTLITRNIAHLQKN
ncbi:MAG: type II toxin-antitoxin system VapC family toxin [Candidatus Bathyarchaeia archaeon]